MAEAERDKRIKRILYQTWYRGCKETDRILGYFAREHINEFSDKELDMLEEIMAESDRDIFDWLTGKSDIPEKYNNNNVMKLLLNFKLAEKNRD